MKHQKKCLEHCWRKTKSESNQAQMKAPIKEYTVALRVAKYCFSAVVSIDSQTVALFKVTDSLLRKDES